MAKAKINNEIIATDFPKIDENKTYYFGVPMSLVGKKGVPDFNSSYTHGSYAGSKLIQMTVNTANDFFNFAPDLLASGQTYELWESEIIDNPDTKTNKSKPTITVFNKIYSEYIGEPLKEVELPKVDTSQFEEKINMLESQLNDNFAQTHNVATSTLTELNNMVRERDRTIAGLYDKLNNIHSDHNKQLQSKDAEIITLRSELDIARKEHQQYIAQKEFEAEMLQKQKEQIEKLEHTYNGKITALSDEVEAANQDDFVDKITKLFENPLVQKGVAVGTAFMEQQMAQNQAPQVPQAPSMPSSTVINPINSFANPEVLNGVHN